MLSNPPSYSFTLLHHKHSSLISALHTITPHFSAFSNSHISVLELKDPLVFTAPILLKIWGELASPEALQWKEKYASCFELTAKLKGGNKTSFY